MLLLFLPVCPDVWTKDEKVEQKPSSYENVAVEIHTLHKLWREIKCIICHLIFIVLHRHIN